MFGEHLYVKTADEVWRIPKTGGPETLLASGLGPLDEVRVLDQIAVDASGVYTVGNGLLSRMPLEGGAPEVLAMIPGDFLALDPLGVTSGVGVYATSVLTRVEKCAE